MKIEIDENLFNELKQREAKEKQYNLKEKEFIRLCLKYNICPICKVNIDTGNKDLIINKNLYYLRCLTCRLRYNKKYI